MAPFPACHPYDPLQVKGAWENLLEKRVDVQSSVHDNVAAVEQILNDHLRQLRLKRSSQRDQILWVLLANRDHLTTEELHDLVRKEEPAIGYTIVYRALRLFTQCGLACGGGSSRRRARSNIASTGVTITMIC